MTDDTELAGRAGTSGHRTVPHPADVRIEAWGATREQCLAEAVLGLVESFADTSGVRATGSARVRVDAGADEDMLADLLDEVIFRLETRGEVPVDAEAEAGEDGLDVCLTVADLAAVPVTGAAPKAVAWQDLHLSPGPWGWSCAVTVDV